MKKPQNPNSLRTRSVESASGNFKSNKGIALISVLTIVTLTTILVLTFFTLARNEMVASVNYADGLHAKQLSDTAVNMVISQIRKATADGTRVWASQPGAIRTFNGASGAFDSGYKLYSAAEMVELASGPTGQSNLANKDFAKLAGWSAQLAQFADLNEPVIRGERIYYPIVDPRARDFPKWTAPREFDDAGIEGFDYNLTGIAPSPMADALSQITDPTTGGAHRTLPMPVEWIYQLEDGTLGSLDASLNFVSFGATGAPTVDNPIIGRIAFWADDETAKTNLNVHAGGTSWDTPRAGGDIDRNLGRYQPAQREWQRYKGHPATTSIAPVLFPGMKNITLNRDEMEKIFRLVPRIVGGGSASGTRSINPNDDKENNGLIPDKDRLYASLDDFILQPGGGRGFDHTNPSISLGTRDQSILPEVSATIGDDERLEQARFFLTVTSRAPELNLFNQPRVSIWPTYYATDPSDKYRLTNFDRLIRYCAQLGIGDSGKPNQYYFQRRNEDSNTADWDDIERNRDVYAYLDKMTRKPIPGYGASFDQKYGKVNRLQLLTEIFDYIRSTNLFDDTVYAEAIPGKADSWRGAYETNNSSRHLTFTNYRQKNELGMHMGHGQVTPIRINYDSVETQGFGRFYTVEEAGIQLICCAEGGTGGGPGIPGGEVSGNAIDYSNFPPLDPSVQQGDDATWPVWLKALQTTDADRANYAANPANWNWMLPKAQGLSPVGYDRAAMPNDTSLMLLPGEKIVQAVFLMEMYSPAAGWTPIQPDMMINVDFNGLQFDGISGGAAFESAPQLGDYANGETPSGGNLWVCNRLNFSAVWGGRNYGGGGGFRSLMRGIGAGHPAPTQHRAYAGDVQPDYNNGWAAGRYAPFDERASGADGSNIYPFITRPFKIDAGQPVTFQGGDPITITILANREENPSIGGANETTRIISAPKSGPVIVQEIEMNLSQLSGMPAPQLAGSTREHVNEFKAIYSRETSPLEWWSASADGANPISANQGRLAASNRPASGTGQFIRPGDSLWTMVLPHGDMRLAAALPKIPHSDSDVEYVPHPNAGGNEPFAHSFTLAQGGSHFPGDTGGDITDLKYPSGKGPLPIPGGDAVARASQLYGDFDNGQGGTIDGAYINKVDEGNTHSLVKRTITQTPGSWEWRRDYGSFPYFVREWTHEPSGPAFFSPNRMMPSPVMFGSMPNMVFDHSTTPNKGAWQTMLFRPDVDGGDFTTHPGAVSPPDHMLLDLFWMPVVEPYVISEPSSTAGRVNMNFQILPFKNITRTSALRGVFQSEYMLCIPNYHVVNYKSGVGRGRRYHWLYSPFDGELQRLSLRSVIVEDATLKQFQERFDRDEVFTATSQICEVHLVPQDIGERQGFANRTGTYTPTVSQMESGLYWTAHKLVGDNGREAPYAHIYPRLTTKSNTFKVHIRSQVLKKARGTDPSVWNPQLDTAVAEYRGSAIVERYIEPADPNIPDYAAANAQSDAESLDLFYKYRVVNEKRFSP